MRFFENPNDGNAVYGYDDADPTQAELIAAAVKAKWTEIAVWPPVPTLAQAQATQIATLDATCQSAIYAGFTSSALGAAYNYPAKDKDQQNLSASVIDGLVNAQTSGWTTPFWCADQTGAWSFRDHTSAQIIQVGKDGKTAVTAALAKCAALKAAVAAATTPAAAQAVVWP